MLSPIGWRGRRQDALDIALPDDRIHVAQGTYKPGAPFAPRTNSFVFKNSVLILGGFEGGCLNPNADNWDHEANLTILDGDLSGDGAINLVDLNIWLASPSSAPFTSNTTIPEPATVALMVCGAAVLLRRRRLSK